MALVSQTRSRGAAGAHLQSSGLSSLSSFSSSGAPPLRPSPRCRLASFRVSSCATRPLLSPSSSTRVSADQVCLRLFSSLVTSVASPSSALPPHGVRAAASRRAPPRALPSSSRTLSASLSGASSLSSPSLCVPLASGWGLSARVASHVSARCFLRRACRAFASHSWEARLAALQESAEAAHAARRGKAVVELTQRGRVGRRSQASAFPLALNRLVFAHTQKAGGDGGRGASEPQAGNVESGDRKDLEALLSGLKEDLHSQPRAEQLKLLVALAKTRPQVLAAAKSSEDLLRALVDGLLLPGAGEGGRASLEGQEVSAKDVLIVLGCVRRLLHIPPFASPQDRSYLRCCQLLRQGRVAFLSSSDLANLLLLLAKPAPAPAAALVAPESEARTTSPPSDSESEEDEAADEEEDAENLRRHLIVMAINIFSDRLEGAAGSPPTLDDVAVLLRASALAGTHADVLRRVFSFLTSAAASSSPDAASVASSARGAARKRRGVKGEKAPHSVALGEVTPQQAIGLLHIMTSARLYSLGAIDALLSRFAGAQKTGEGDEAPAPLPPPLPLASAALSAAAAQGGGASAAEQLLRLSSAGCSGGTKKEWNLRSLGTRSEALRLLKVVELTLRLDLPHTFAQLSPSALRVLATIRDTPFVDPTLVTDNVLSYQLAHFLRKHRFPCERSMEGPYALRLADLERRLVVVPLDAADEEPASVYRQPAASEKPNGEAEGEGPEEAPREASSAGVVLRAETKARLAHLNELGWRVLVVHHRDWNLLNSQMAKARFVRNLLQKNGLIDLAPARVAA
ncbi:hypothetical protein BESB_085500 [Besnoitia besnoiti]|uniref:RAP domain-containing protein n=1 Tax=Besnoitia besnoiti TaxID=94643 RepID=A0A2A9MAL9_BESBE|nr:hypothetical protein BESB_085500 [Besnoitia besnoiti]PFH33351.1 hypothetical protein BESB_085500 [Besnoitia besnoiti]